MKKSLITILCATFLVGTAYADWNEADGHKMHYPQLPDEDGWDIDMTNYILADDWTCSETGLVDDIHFWLSIEYGSTPGITAINVSIHNDDRTGEFSKPGTQLRTWSFNNFTMIPVDNELDQGWDDPQSNQVAPVCRYPDHKDYWQVNITDISELVTDPFIQQEGTIYWLDLQIVPSGDHLHGWKTTEGIWEDAAVYQTSGGGWQQVLVCTDDHLTDFAFVITPEPATVALLGLGSLVHFPRRVRR
jgi:hypothetical protein